MQTELRKAQNREILANARLHQTSHCPNCGKRQWYVIETTPLGGRDIRRRRRRCDHWGHRDTTYEIPAFMYRQMQKDRKVVDDISKALGSNDKPAFNIPAVEESNVDCDDCRFNSGNSCSFGLPEFQTSDSRDCVNFQKGD